MQKQFDFIDFITLLSFAIGLYSLEIALDNLEENREQNDELKQILHYLEVHLQDQDNHLELQDKLITKLTKGE